MKRLFLILALSASLPATATIVMVNGKPITVSELEHTLQVLRIENASDEQRKAIIDELISRDVLAQEAIKLGIDKKEDIKISLEASRKDILISALLQEWSEKNQITDDELKKLYDETFREQAKQKEYRVRHILIKEELKAHELLAAIQSKKISFEDAAKKESMDYGSASNGGDLDWANPEMFVPEFAQAVISAKKGEVSEPVKSPYGYHLIKVEDQRFITPPSFEQAKPDLARLLSQKKMFEYVESLRAKSKIEMK